MPGASVPGRGPAARVCTSLVYRWRRTLLCDGMASEALPLPGAAFVPVEVASAPMVPQRSRSDRVWWKWSAGRATHPPGTSHRRAGAEGRAGRVRLIGPPSGVRCIWQPGSRTCARVSTDWRRWCSSGVAPGSVWRCVYAFRGRRGDLVKLLWWDGQGLVLHAKRLERGRFTWPATADGVAVLTPAQLSMLLEGVGLAASDPVLAADFGLVESTVSCGFHVYRHDCSGISGRVARCRLAARRYRPPEGHAHCCRRRAGAVADAGFARLRRMAFGRSSEKLTHQADQLEHRAGRA